LLGQLRGAGESVLRIARKTFLQVFSQQPVLNLFGPIGGHRTSKIAG
jgi:hypothetical protein